MGGVKIENNVDIKGLKRHFKLGRQKALQDAGKTITNEAKRVVPVDTGELKDSIDYEVINDEAVEISATAEHASAVEFGTSKQAPQPYMRPSLNSAEHILTEAIKKNTGGN